MGVDFHRIKLYFERVLFTPKRFDWLIVTLLSPLSIVYELFTFVNALQKHLRQKEHHDNIIGVGNLVLGGTGKTPLIVALAKREREVAIILRGYNRDSKGTILVSRYGELLVDLKVAGDEATLYSQLLPEATVIVSENRISGIELAKKLNAKTIFLDDSYRHHHIKKRVEYLIEYQTSNPFSIPAGPFRERLWFFKRDIIKLKEGIDFTREVKIENPTEKMVLITAISKPKRLDRYIDGDIPKYYFPDHYNFREREISDILEREKPTSILTTEKDLVKLERFKLNFSVMRLEIKFQSRDGLQ